MKIPPMSAAKTELWLFPDGIGDSVILEVVEEKEKLSKDGKMKIPVLCCMGRVGEFVGDVIISLWKLRTSKEIITALGDDTALWAKKQIKLVPSEDKKFFVAYP